MKMADQILSRRGFNASCFALLLAGGVEAVGAEGKDRASKPFNPEFYAFENGVNFGNAQQEAAALKSLGYHGVSQAHVGGEKLAQRIAAYDKVGVKVLSIYLNFNDKPVSVEDVKPLADRDALIELTVQKMTPTTVEAVKKTAELASELNIKVVLYPHARFAIETTTQAMAMVEKVGHPNLGIMLNLCHYLKSEKAEDLEAVIEKISPHLFAASTSGADLGGKNWKELIKPLDEGSFPQRRLLAALKKHGFDGPVGLQCYGVRGDKRENLKRSMAAWKKVLEEL